MLTGKELKIKRIQKDLLAIDIAKRLGVHKSYISKMEKGACNTPKEIYEKWVKLLGVK